MVCCCFLGLIHIVIKDGGRHYCMSHTGMGRGNPCTMSWLKSCGEVQKKMSFMRYSLTLDSEIAKEASNTFLFKNLW